MSVELNNKIPVKPGFGKKLSAPTFNKPSLSSTRGADGSVFSNSKTLNRTSLKESVGRNISSTSLNRSFSTEYANSNSSLFGNRRPTFTPGTHFLGTSDFSFPRNDLRNGINTTGIGYDSSAKGYRSGKHDLELMTGGWTQRSERRAFQRMGMVDLNTLQEPSGGKKKMSLLAKIGIGIGVAGLGVGAYFGIKGLINKNKASKAENKPSAMEQLNQLSQQQSQGDGTVKSKAANTTQPPVSKPQTNSKGSIGNLQNATTSAECYNINDQLSARQKELDTELRDVFNTLNSTKGANDAATESFDNATMGITKANRNIQKQSGVITKLQSELSQLQSQSSQISDEDKAAYNDSLKSLQQAIKDAETSKKESEDALKQYEAQKEEASRTMAQCEQDIEKLSAQKENLEMELTEVMTAANDSLKKGNELERKEQGMELA